MVITGRDPKTLAEVEHELGPVALAIRSDVADLPSLDAVMQQVRHRHGRIDVLFVNAGIGHLCTIPEVTPEVWDEVHDVNLRGCFFAAQKALPLMGHGGSIVFTGSIAACWRRPANAIYAAAKAGLRAVTRIFAVELVGKGIRVNMVSPGPTETPLINRNLGMDAQAVDALRQMMIANTPMRRMGTPAGNRARGAVPQFRRGQLHYGVDLFVDGGVIEL